jgi:anti-sigma factor RsiW
MTVRSPLELTCQEVVELVTEYLSHAMPANDRVRFEQHLLTCPPCTAYLGQLKATIDLAGGLHGGALAPEVERDLMGLFRRWKPKG